MKTLEELEQIRKNTFEQIKMRVGEKIDSNRKNILVCGGTGCTSSKSPKIIEELEREIKEKHLENEVQVIKTGCFGLCAKGPIMIVYPGETFYTMVKPEDVPEIVEEHIVNGNVVERLLIKDTETEQLAHTLHELGFYQKQNRHF